MILKKKLVVASDPVDEEDLLAKLSYYFEGVDGVTCIALFGIDAEEGQTGRSDTIIILTIDTKHNHAKGDNTDSRY